MMLIKGTRWKAEQNEAEDEGLLSGVKLDVLDEYRVSGHDNNSVVIAVQFNQADG